MYLTNEDFTACEGNYTKIELFYIFTGVGQHFNYKRMYGICNFRFYLHHLKERENF